MKDDAPRPQDSLQPAGILHHPPTPAPNSGPANSIRPYKAVKANAWPFRVDRRDLSQIYVKVPNEGWRSIQSTNPSANDMPFGSTATHAAKCLPSIDDDPGFLSRRESGAHVDALLDNEEDHRAQRSPRPLAKRNERAQAAAADRNSTTLKARESNARKQSTARRAETDELGDFSPTIYDVGAG